MDEEDQGTESSAAPNLQLAGNARISAPHGLNLQAHHDASVVLVDGPRPVRARAAKGDERSRLWGRWREIDAKLDAYAALRSSETAVVILESRPEPGQ
jgi:hypothetical protein